MIMMQPTLLLLFVLPPPSAGTLGVAGRDSAGARGTADRCEAAIMQTIVGNAVLTDERKRPLACPVEQGIHLDQLVMCIDGSKQDVGAFVRLILTQTRDPRGSACEGALERLTLRIAQHARRAEREV